MLRSWHVAAWSPLCGRSSTLLERRSRPQQILGQSHALGADRDECRRCIASMRQRSDRHDRQLANGRPRSRSATSPGSTRYARAASSPMMHRVVRAIEVRSIDCRCRCRARHPDVGSSDLVRELDAIASIRSSHVADSRELSAASVRVRDRVAEHVDEDGLGEGVELGEGLAAFGSERIGRIQHRRNPPLLLDRRERDLDLRESTLAQMLDGSRHGRRRSKRSVELAAEPAVAGTRGRRARSRPQTHARGLRRQSVTPVEMPTLPTRSRLFDARDEDIARLRDAAASRARRRRASRASIVDDSPTSSRDRSCSRASDVAVSRSSSASASAPAIDLRRPRRAAPAVAHPSIALRSSMPFWISSSSAVSSSRISAGAGYSISS